MRQMIVVGGAPSSGSTLLADILDSVPGVACGPELYIFCDPGAYRFDERFKEKAFHRVPYQPASPYANPRPFFNEKHMSGIGLNTEMLASCIQDSSSLPEFFDRIRLVMERFRKLDIDVLAEKTPININEASRFCESFPRSVFVHIVRDPRSNIPSLIKRGFMVYEATLIWLVQNLFGLQAAGYPNYYRIRFEDLKNDPFGNVRDILSRVGINVDSEKVEECFQTNQYRMQLERPGTWNVSQFEGKVVDGASRSLLADHEFALLREAFLECHNDLALHGRSRIWVRDLVEEIGYTGFVDDGQEAQAADEKLDDWRNRYYKESKNVFKQRYYRISEASDCVLSRESAGQSSRSDSEMRILQGVSGQAGQPRAFAVALRARGHKADACTIVRHPFNYATDIEFSIPGGYSIGNIFAAISNLVEGYDIFHFHSRSFVTRYKDLCIPSLMDLLFLKSIGKKVFIHLRGSEIRQKSVFEKKNPFHFDASEEEGLRLFESMPQRSKYLMRDFVESVCDGVFVVDQEIKEYVGHSAIVVPRVICDDNPSFEGVGERRRPVIVHAPSRREVKGTSFVIDAVERLNAEGVRCDLRLVEGKSHEEAMEEYRNADIVVDQLRLGWYGVLAVEGFALGKPVVCYIREDLWKEHGEGLPVVNANPETIVDELRFLVRNAEHRRILGRKGRKFFEDYHDADSVAARLEYLYQTCSKPVEEVDWVRCCRILDQQIEQYAGMRCEQAIAGERKKREDVENSVGVSGERVGGKRVGRVLRSVLRRVQKKRVHL